tara:strand:+ start:6199 stop:9975 length:3777 start_codon:yes stop_codon:yes gene_type:complete
MGSFDDTFRPVNVGRPRGPLGDQEDVIGNAVLDLGAAPVAPAPVAAPVEPEVQEEPQEDTSSFDSMFTPVEEEEEEDEFGSTFSRAEDEEVGGFVPSTPGELPARILPNGTAEERRIAEEAAYTTEMLGDIEPGSYTPNDLSENDEMYGIIEAYMKDRYGIQAIEDETREAVVERFLNNRRGVAMSGNATRVVSEMDYIWDISENDGKLRNAGAAYALYENMQGITGEDYTWGETGWATMDVIRGVVSDPVTWITAGAGKLIAGAGTRATTQAVESIVAKSIQEQIRQGVSREAIRANAANMYRQAAAQAVQEGTEDVARFAAQNSVQGLQRLANREAVTEVGATTALDAVAGAGMEYLYQLGLMETGVQDEVNRYAVGLAALGSLVVGGATAGLITRRGSSGTALPTEAIQAPDASRVSKSLSDSIRDFFQSDLPPNVSWADKVGTGGELNVQDTDFFIDFLLGSAREATEEGASSPSWSGLAQIMQENGFFYVKRVDDDTISNYISDFITKEMDPEGLTDFIKTFEEASGTKLTGFLDEAGNVVDGIPTPEQFANAFARKMHDQARGLNAASQVARRLDVNIEDLNIDTFLKDQLGLMGLGPQTASDRFAATFSNTVTQGISNSQNRYIRTLVSHIGTSKLNVLGWAVSSSMGSTSDLVRGLGLATRASYNRAMGNEAQSISDAHLSRSIIEANANRINLLLDPNMTVAAFNSAVQRSTGGLGDLGRVQAGGIDVEQSVDQLINRTGVGRAADGYIEGAQLLTLVRAQDVFTKSQQYVFEMDKALRINFGRSWNEFYNAEDVSQLMATRQYRLMEEEAVANTLEHTFSASFKGNGLLGELAGVMEDARNIPGIGMMVPFGKFFNNTVHFTARNTPGLNQFMKAFGGQFQNKTHGELFTQGAVASGLIYSYAQIAQEERSQGLGLYETMDEETGEVISREYDYPLSLFIAAGHMASYRMNGEEIPADVLTRVGEDFGLTGVTRGLTQTTGDLADAVKLMIAGEFEVGSGDLASAGGSVAAQAVAGFTRPLEGPDTLLGIMFGTEMRPLNTKDGNRFTGRALTYMDNSIQLLTGGPAVDVRIGAQTGEADPVTAKQLGTRNVMLTDTMRVMSMLEYENWDENASFQVSEMAADVANEYNRLFFESIEDISRQAMEDETFRTLPLEDQRDAWDKVLVSVRENTRIRMAYESYGEGSTFSDQLYIIEKFGSDTTREAMRELELGDDIGELDLIKIDVLRSYLDRVDEIKEYEQRSFTFQP